MPPLFLIGYRGTGKSTVARLLAERLGWVWIDADARIEEVAGCSIADIFAAQGEDAFRDMESQVVAELAHCDRTVVALGGGAVLREANRQALLGRGPIVWLTAPAELLHERIAADALTRERRPNLTATGGITEIIATLAAREPIYRQCADLEIDTTGKTPAAVADAIVEWISVGGQ